jgi:hypothetical protein
VFVVGGASVDAGADAAAAVDVVVDVEGKVVVVAVGENGSRPRPDVDVDVDVVAPVDVEERARAENESSNPVPILVPVVDTLSVSAPVLAPVDWVCSGRVRLGCHRPVEPVDIGEMAVDEEPVYVGGRERLPEPVLVPGVRPVGFGERVGNDGGGPGGGAYVWVHSVQFRK